MSVSYVLECLGEHGSIRDHLPNFAPREAQLKMAEAVTMALEESSTLIVEAGTGTGKTLAYLVPALSTGLRVIISTGTKNLQEQLFHRDIPMVKKALAASAKVAMLKGRSNYLCLHRLANARFDGKSASGSDLAKLECIARWSGQTRCGDISECSQVPEQDGLWTRVTSTSENCLGQECPEYGECFVIKARRSAQEADLVVINHHLLCADMALKEEGFGDLLPGADAMVLDEAHQLPEVASQFFGLRLSSQQLLELIKDIQVEYLKQTGLLADLPSVCDQIEIGVRELRLKFDSGIQRTSWAQLGKRLEIEQSLELLRQQLIDLGEWLKDAVQRNRGLENCLNRCLEFVQRLDIILQPKQEQYTLWVDIRRRVFVINLTPIEIASAIQQHMQTQHCAWIFTSATLAVGKKFEHFQQRMGIDGSVNLCLDSPFDFESNALLYVPESLPDPNDISYTKALVEAAIPVIRASRGRAFMLFTSHRALQEAAQHLGASLTNPLLVQGSAPRGDLLQRFRDLPDPILLGSHSFWEGVDVRGPDLSCVIIDRLPFASPNDPVLQARIERLRSDGGNPFIEYQLPNAVIALKQGVGRLIRDVDDRGVLMLCDPRLYRKSYGKIFLNSLPQMSVTNSISDVTRFLER